MSLRLALRGLGQYGISEEQAQRGRHHGPGLVSAFWSIWQRQVLAWAHDTSIPVNYMAGHRWQPIAWELLRALSLAGSLGQRRSY